MKPLAKIIRIGTVQPGDYVAIPREDARYVHARIYDRAIGVLPGVADAPLSLDALSGLVPERYFYYCSLPGGRYQRDWIFIARVPFADPEEKWPPAMSTTDGIYKTKPQVYWKGRFHDVTEADLAGKAPWIIHGFTALHQILSGTYDDPWQKLPPPPAGKATT